MDNNQWISGFDGRHPVIDAEAFVDLSARLVGQVRLAGGTSVWPLAVIRADSEAVDLDNRAAVLDLALLEAPTGHPVRVGAESIISHRAVVHGATIEPGVLIGIGAIVLDGAVIKSGSIVGAGSVVPPRTVVGPEALVLGIPGKTVRQTTPAERDNIKAQVEELYVKSRIYLGQRAKGRPSETPLQVQ
jgi:carbonic anhydrase/acetyltransferase-like protein (isoleucine patch superfamily)